MIQRQCPQCRSILWTTPQSDKKYCSKTCANQFRSQIMKIKGKAFDTQKARDARTPDDFRRQAQTLARTWSQRKARQRELWSPQDTNDLARVQEALRSSTPEEPARKRIHKHGIIFDSRPELVMYEKMSKGGIYATRPATYNNWHPDFSIPEREMFVEVKSWHTVLFLQGLDHTVRKLDPNVLFIEEDDVYSAPVNGLWSFMEEMSVRFKGEILRRQQLLS